VIRSFWNKKLKRLYEGGDAAGLPAGQAEKISDVLAVLDLVDYHLSRLKPGFNGVRPCR
jgi:hypothetical protein